MKKTAFIFPGQGAQYVGMGKEFYEQIPVCRQMIDLASEVTGLNIPELCFEENEQLHITEYTQIAMVSVSVAIMEALKEKGIRADMTAGLSLGEYAALAASEVMDIRDIFSLVRKRGIFMQSAVPTGGAMAAVLGADTKQIEEICLNTEGQVSIANYNCPGQIVITGEEQAVTEAGVKLKEAGAKRVIPLKVSGPFHSPMLKKAGEQLAEELKSVEVRKPVIPYLANVTADYVTDPADVKQLLAQQVCDSVRWQQTIEKMIADGVDTFIEIGPGKTLTGFIRKINRNVTAWNVDKMTDFNRIVAELCGDVVENREKGE